MDKKTHTVVPQPEISVRHLADFMAATERGKRSLVESAKYRPIARLVQHRDAKVSIANLMLKGELSPDKLKEKSEFVRGKLADGDFERLVNETNADYLLRLSEVCNLVDLPPCELHPAGNSQAIIVNGVKIRFAPDLALKRTTKTNKLKVGAVMLRYAKGKALSPDVGAYQSAAIHGLLSVLQKDDGTEAQRELCLTLDGYSGTAHAAPGNSPTIFKNMQAACLTIAERWDNIPAPKGAVL